MKKLSASIKQAKEIIDSKSKTGKIISYSGKTESEKNEKEGILMILI